MLVDSHCHLYLEEFDLDREEVLKRAMAQGVGKFYMPAVDSSTVNRMLELEESFPGVCVPMIGLHPCSVKGAYEAELMLVREWLTKRSFAAIGEIGLDFYWDKTFIKEQYDAFRTQISLAVEYQLPIVIHTREAMQETIDVIREFHGRVRGIFHCFGGSLEEAKHIMDLGFYMGIGGVVTYKKSGLAEVIRQIGIDHIVLETDSPYLAPVPFRGKRNESSYLTHIATKIAEVTGIPVEKIAATTTENALKIFAS